VQKTTKNDDNASLLRIGLAKDTSHNGAWVSQALGVQQQTWIINIKIGLLESYTAGFLPLKMPACATLDVDVDDMMPVVILIPRTGILLARRGATAE
jgi:hypothetical protein